MARRSRDGEVVGATLAVARQKLTKKFPIF
nr:MAG TPA: hypothetical protein [Caudoviricetes sp.]